MNPPVVKYFLCVLNCVLSLTAGAAPPLVLRDVARDYPLGLHWDVLLVPNSGAAALTLRQVRAPAWAARFRASTQRVPNLGQQDADVWLRCRLRSTAPAATRWVLRGHLFVTQQFEFFVVDAAGRVRRQQAGPDQPFAATHYVPDRHFNLALPLPPGQPVLLYVHTGSGLLDFRITEERHLYQIVRGRDLAAALYFGALITLLLYNLLLFGSVRDRSYLYYVLYVAAFGLLQADMMGYLYRLWPIGEETTRNSLQLALLGLVIIFGVLTARSFLETRRLLPRLDRLLRGLLGLAALPWLAQMASGAFPAAWVWLSVGTPLAACGLLLAAGVAVLRTGYAPARYYMAGWGLLILAIIVYYLRTLGLLPVSFLTEYGVRISSVLEMILLSMGLASRINLARRAQQAAQARALEVLREKEEAQRLANQQLAARAQELGRAHAELRASLATTGELQTLDELKTRFFTNISHELRTPLTLILSPLEQLLGDDDAPSAHPELTLMHRNARRLLHLINQLLDIARLEAGSMSLLATPLDLEATLRAALAAFAPLALAQDVRLRLDLPPAYPDAEPLYADCDKLEQIIYNLLSNALKFTPPGGQVGVSGAYAEGHLELAVRDTGIGIAAGELPRVFERFHQADASHTRRYGGSGIGLALVRELVALHGGTVAVSSVEGEGSTFRVRLPLGTAHLRAGEIGPPAEAAPAAGPRWVEVPTAVSEPQQEEEEEAAAHDARPLVLLVDDNADLRHYLRQCLGPAYRLLLAADGAQGLARARAALPDLVVSDLMMPVLDGLALCRCLKTDERTSHIPVVLLTARASEGSRLQALETGADDYLTKPFRPAELRTRVANLIAQRRQLRQHYGREVTLQPGDVRITPMDEQFLTRALAVVEQHLADADFAVEDFAAALAMSRIQLYRKLKALTDQAPTEFVRTLRLRRAAQLLAGQAGTVADVAYAVGFNNLSYFSKCFRELHGHAPSGHLSQAQVPVPA